MNIGKLGLEDWGGMGKSKHRQRKGIQAEEQQGRAEAGTPPRGLRQARSSQQAPRTAAVAQQDSRRLLPTIRQPSLQTLSSLLQQTGQGLTQQQTREARAAAQQQSRQAQTGAQQWSHHIQLLTKNGADVNNN